MFSNELSSLMGEVACELTDAMRAHGPMRSAHEAYAVIAEELDEFWDEVKRNPAKMSLAEFDAYQATMRKELIQTAAMCVRAIIDLNLPAVDRKGLRE